MSAVQLHRGDTRKVLERMPAGRFDACVTDPPYGYGFMGMGWDRDVPPVEYWRAMLHATKDGGRLLAFGATRTHHRTWTNIEDAGWTIEDTIMWVFGQGWPKAKSKLKPGWEPICVARKGTSTDLNIDACRIPMSQADADAINNATGWGKPDYLAPEGFALNASAQRMPSAGASAHPEGRYPANLALDEDAAAELDAQTAELRPGGDLRGGEYAAMGYGGGGEHRPPTPGYGDSGGASRFFYCPKASTAERNRGLEGLPASRGGRYAQDEWSRENMGNVPDARRRPVQNNHPTVKPVALMRWLIRLVAEPGDEIADPFMGSGSTGIAAVLEGVDFYGIDRDYRSVAMAHYRIHAAQPSLFSGL